MSFSEQQCKWYVRGSAVPATVHKITGGGSSTGAGVAQPGNQRAGVKYKVYHVFYQMWVSILLMRQISSDLFYRLFRVSISERIR